MIGLKLVGFDISQLETESEEVLERERERGWPLMTWNPFSGQKPEFVICAQEKEKKKNILRKCITTYSSCQHGHFYYNWCTQNADFIALLCTYVLIYTDFHYHQDFYFWWSLTLVRHLLPSTYLYCFSCLFR